MLVLIPSRGRPEGLRRTLDTCLDTHTKARILIRIDSDDPMRGAYSSLKIPRGVIVGCGNRARPAAAMVEALSMWPDEDAYFLMSDDAIPHTDEWDEKLRIAAGPSGVSYPDDGIWGRHKATHPCVGGDLVRAIGWWALPGLIHLYVDAVYDFLGRQLGCLRYCPEILVEHLHWAAGKSEKDQTYERIDNGEDQKCFQKWMYAPQTLELVRRLRSIAK